MERLHEVKPLTQPLGWVELEQLYKKFNYPGQDKLYQLAKKEGLRVTIKQIKEFLNKQQVAQVYKKESPKKGFIVSFNPDEKVQMDLIDMSNFVKRNKGYSWIFVIIDIFTRKIIAYPIKKKDVENIEDVLMKYFDDHHPQAIISDNESGWKSKIIQKLLTENEVTHDMVEPGDHKALGVIDRAVQTIKNAIYKYMKDENTSSYIDKLPSIIESYNNTPHSGILDITPNEATKKKNVERLQALNHQKNLINIKNRGSFKVGDVVRIRTKRTTFKRSYDENFSDETYRIEDIDGTYAVLDDGQRVNLRRLVKSSEMKNKPEKDELKEARKEAKIEKAIKKVGIDTSNIVESKRKSKPSRRFDD